MHCPGLLHPYLRKCYLYNNLVKVTDCLGYKDAYRRKFWREIQNDRWGHEVKMVCKENYIFSPRALVRGISTRVDSVLENCGMQDRCIAGFVRSVNVGPVRQISQSMSIEHFLTFINCQQNISYHVLVVLGPYAILFCVIQSSKGVCGPLQIYVKCGLVAGAADWFGAKRGALTCWNVHNIYFRFCVCVTWLPTQYICELGIAAGARGS